MKYKVLSPFGGNANQVFEHGDTVDSSDIKEGQEKKLEADGFIQSLDDEDLEAEAKKKAEEEEAQKQADLEAEELAKKEAAEAEAKKKAEEANKGKK